MDQESLEVKETAIAKPMKYTGPIAKEIAKALVAMLNAAAVNAVRPEPLSYSIDGAVHASGIGRTMLYELIKDGRLPIRKAGRRTLILHADLQAALEALPKTNVIGGPGEDA